MYNVKKIKNKNPTNRTVRTPSVIKNGMAEVDRESQLSVMGRLTRGSVLIQMKQVVTHSEIMNYFNKK